MSSLNRVYEKMSSEELVRERETIDALLAERHEAEKQTLLAEFRERARVLGIDPVELTGGSRRGGKRGKVRPKYRHPDDPSRTWTGRGRKPKWIEDRLEAGTTLEDMMIERSTSET